jgi:hypothetical protein
MDMCVALQQRLWDWHRSGFSFGSHLAVLAARPLVDSEDRPTDAHLDTDRSVTLIEPFHTVAGYFGWTGSAKRTIYDDNLSSLLLSFSFGAVPVGPLHFAVEDFSGGEPQSCGRCLSPSCGKAHTSCIQVYFNGKLLNGGVCTNCLRSGNAQACSFRRKFRSLLRFSFSFVRNCLTNAYS